MVEAGALRSVSCPSSTAGLRTATVVALDAVEVLAVTAARFERCWPTIRR